MKIWLHASIYQYIIYLYYYRLLEQAEMRRLEEQLRMLRVAQEREIGRQHDITAAVRL